MVTIAELWQPILLSAILVFVVSWVMNVFMPHHRGDFGTLPDEAAAQAALRGLAIAPGDYVLPHVKDMKSFKDPAFLDLMQKGPRVLMRVRAGAAPSMNKELGQWFLFLLLVGLSAAYLASRTLAPGTGYMEVFRVASFVAFVAYCYGACIESIWYWRRWRATATAIFDGLIYALLTGGVFGWLWPVARAAVS